MAVATKARTIIAPKRALLAEGIHGYIALGNSTAALDEANEVKRACIRFGRFPQCKQQQKSQDKT